MLEQEAVKEKGQDVDLPLGISNAYGGILRTSTSAIGDLMIR
jgi:hypothetical protein